MKKKLNKILKNKNYILVIILLFIFFIIYSTFEKTEDASYLQSKHALSKPKRETVVYTKQYSDRVNTDSAKVALEKYSGTSFFERRNLLSNAFSSLLHRRQVLSDVSLENGTWLWTPVKYITPEYRDSIITGAKKNGVNVIYLAIDSYLDIFVMEEGVEKQKELENFNSTVKDFIRTANNSGIKVDAAAGWQNWAEEGHLYKPGAVLDYVIAFNRDNEEKFRGFQYDVEVYLLPQYKNNKEKVLTNFLDLMDKTVTKLNSTDLEFTVVVPEFYDDSTVETPIFKYKGKNRYTIEHLLSVLERRRGSKIIVMSYRNFAQGENGSIEISEDEIFTANNFSTKVVIAQETGDFPPSYITFNRKSKSYFNSQLALLKNAFENEPSYGGIATHYVNTFLELK
jgi:hypothetical protein